MSTEYKLSFTASEINEKLRKVDQLSTEKEVAVQNNQPTSSTLWIDTDSNDEIILAEIDDDTVSDEKTWSSTKIKTLLNSGGGSGGGVSSWNDLTDKPFSYKLIEDTTLVENQSLSTATIVNPDSNIYVAELNYPLFNIEEGKTYTIQWDGTTYKSTGEIMEVSGMTGAMVGNKALISYIYGGSYTDNGMPFCIGVMGATVVIAVGEEHTINVRYIEEELKTLDAKYLPVEDIKNIVDEVINEALHSGV